MNKVIASFITVVICLTACTAPAKWPQRPEVTIPKLEPSAESSVYTRLLKREDSPLLHKSVTANFPPGSATLHTAIISGLPFQVTVITEDDHVNLHKSVAARASGASVKAYLKQLEGLTGYQISLDPVTKTVKVASLVTKTWHLSALAGMGNFSARIGFGLGNDGDNNSSNENGDSQRSYQLQSTTAHDDDVWGSLVRQAECIIGVNTCVQGNNEIQNLAANAALQKDDAEETKAWLLDNRRLGTITAIAPPFSIARLNEWLQDLSDESLRLISMDCAILDIAFDKDTSLGFDFDGVFHDGRFSVIHRNTGPESESDQGWTLGSMLDSRRFDLDLFIKHLSRKSNVKVKSRVRLSVTNGATAYLNTGEEFSYVSDVETVASQGVATTAFNQSRLQAGLQLAITPRLVGKDGKMLIEVIPILSSVIRFDELGSGENRIRAPVIALRQLSSQAVTSNGRPIAIGSLNWDKSSNGVNSLSRDKSRESRQLLIVITPQEITL